MVMAAGIDYVVLAIPGGKIVVLSSSDLSIVTQHQHTKTDPTDPVFWCTDLKFSPDGTMLGVATMDKSVTVYNIVPGKIEL